MRKNSKLWQAFLAVSISAFTVPAFVQGQAAGGGAAGTAGGSVSPGAAGTFNSPSVGGSGSQPNRVGPTRAVTPEMSPQTGLPLQGNEMSRTPTSPGNIPGGAGATGGIIRDQSMTGTDADLNGRIRESLSSDSSLNAASQNVRISSNNGVVTLQGSVATEKEKDDLETKLQHMTGVKSVDNQLQIAPRTGTSSATGSSTIR